MLHELMIDSKLRALQSSVSVSLVQYSRKPLISHLLRNTFLLEDNVLVRSEWLQLELMRVIL